VNRGIWDFVLEHASSRNKTAWIFSKAGDYIMGGFPVIYRDCEEG
jgi:hypothetical protein